MSFPTPMTQEQIQNAIYEMDCWLTTEYNLLKDVPHEAQMIHLMEMIGQMKEMAQNNDYATREKLMRWIGFMQGVLNAHGYFTIDEFRAMNTK